MFYLSKLYIAYMPYFSSWFLINICSLGIRKKKAEVCFLTWHRHRLSSVREGAGSLLYVLFTVGSRFTEPPFFTWFMWHSQFYWLLMLSPGSNLTFYQPEQVQWPQLTSQGQCVCREGARTWVFGSSLWLWPLTSGSCLPDPLAQSTATTLAVFQPPI